MPDLTLSSQLSHAQGLIDRGDPSGAIVVCRQILLALPRCLEPYAILGQAMLVGGHLERAEALCARTLAVDPQHAEAALGMGLVQHRRGAHGAGRAWFQRAWESSRDGERARATWFWSAVATEAGWEPGTLSRGGLAFLMLRSGMFSQAALEFSGALEQTPSRDDLAVGLAQATYRAGDHEAASHVCERLLERLPDCLVALLIRGRLGLGSAEDALAREMLRRAQTLEPENRVAQRLFGNESPLPLRSVRVPMADTEPTGLLYLDAGELWDGDEEEEEEGSPPSLDRLLRG